MKSGMTSLDQTKTKNPLDVQIGGGHYKDFEIQPIEYCMRNKLDHCQSNVVKYTSRCKEKGGLEDIKKAIHYLELMAFFYYGETLGKPQK